MDEATEQDPRIPGARYRRVTREVVRAVTIDGETELIPQKVTTYVALPPRDWRRIVTAAVVAVTGVVVVISLGWTTASVGALLALGVTAAIAYSAAAVFDLTWIACMGAEWLARYDDDAVRLPRTAGWVALVASMAAVFTHGWIIGSVEAGAVGSFISLLAKGLFTVVMRLTTPELDEAQRGWLKARRGKIRAQRVLAEEQRGLNRDTAKANAERAVLGLAAPDSHPRNGSGSADPTGPANAHFATHPDAHPAQDAHSDAVEAAADARCSARVGGPAGDLEAEAGKAPTPNTDDAHDAHPDAHRPQVIQLFEGPEPGGQSRLRIPHSDVGALDPELIEQARALDSEARAETGRPASLRRMQTQLRIGQTRAQRVRRALDADTRRTS